MNKIYKKKLLYLLCLITALFLSSPKASMAFVDGWCEWQGTNYAYNDSCPKDCRTQTTEDWCNAVKIGNSETQCCRWVKNNVIETSQTSSDDRAYTETLGATSKPIVFKPSVGLPGFPNNTSYVFKDDSTSPIAQLMAEIYKYAIQIIAVLSLIVIIIGGFLWSTAGGSGQKVTGAKQWIFSGLGGLSLTLLSYLLLATINVNLVNLKTSSIGAIATKNLVATNKSEEDQLYDDCSMFDQYYANAGLIAKNGSPVLDACCFVYESGGGLVNKAYGVSYAYTPTMIENVRNECIKYAIKQTGDNSLGSFYQDKGGGCEIPGNCHLSDISSASTYYPLGTQYTHTFLYAQSSFTILTDSGSILSINDLTQENISNIQIGMPPIGTTIILIEDKACWNLGGLIKSATQGKDAGNYCQGKSNYTSCLLNNPNDPSKRLWGYCLDNTCQQCKTYGEKVDNKKMCPAAKKIQGNNNCVSNFKCGNDINSVDDSGYCQCNIKKCMDICNANIKAAVEKEGKGIIKDVCEGR